MQEIDLFWGPGPMNTIMSALLDMAVRMLGSELKKIEHTWAPANRYLLIKHNGKDTIFVWASIEYKAYVPKSYLAWKVRFIEWDGSQLDFSTIYDI